jgi:hypothetical protein
MPRPGEVASPTFKQGDELAYGEAAAANGLQHLAPEPAFEDEQQAFEPSGEQDEYLYGPSDRPGEPITAGAPFGPGASTPLGGFRSDAEVVNTVARQISANPNASPETKAWAARVKAGE